MPSYIQVAELTQSSLLISSAQEGRRRRRGKKCLSFLKAGIEPSRSRKVFQCCSKTCLWLSFIYYPWFRPEYCILMTQSSYMNSCSSQFHACLRQMKRQQPHRSDEIAKGRLNSTKSQNFLTIAASAPRTLCACKFSHSLPQTFIYFQAY